MVNMCIKRHKGSLRTYLITSKNQMRLFVQKQRDESEGSVRVRRCNDAKSEVQNFGSKQWKWYYRLVFNVVLLNEI